MVLGHLDQNDKLGQKSGYLTQKSDLSKPLGSGSTSGDFGNSGRFGSFWVIRGDFG